MSSRKNFNMGTIKGILQQKKKLLSSKKSHSSVGLNSTTKSSDKGINDLVAERYFVKRTKRSFDLSSESKYTSKIKLKLISAKLERAMQRRGFTKNPDFFLGPKIPSSPNDRQVFVAPKHYLCECCNHKLFNVVAYIKHLRKHKLANRCSACNQCFYHVLIKKRHELSCSKKTKLRY